MVTISGIPASADSMMASAAKAGGTKIRLQFAPAFCTDYFHRIEYRNIIHFLPTFAGRYACHHLATVFNTLARVKLSFFSGYPLNDDSCIFINKYAHCLLP